MTGLKYPETVCNFCRKPTKGKNIRKRTIKEDEDEDSTSLLHNQKKALKTDNGLYFSTASSKSASDKLILQFPSSKQIQYQNDSRATATLETETEFTKDARAIREKVLKRAEEALKGKNRSSGEDKLYTGMHGYADHKAGFEESKQVAHMDLLGLLPTLGFQQDLIISQKSAKISNKLVSVVTEIHASLCMIVEITSLDGRHRRIGKKQRKQGRQIWL